VDVDRLVRLLLVELRPVESDVVPVDKEVIPLCAVLMPVDVEVDNEAI